MNRKHESKTQRGARVAVLKGTKHRTDKGRAELHYIHVPYGVV